MLQDMTTEELVAEARTGNQEAVAELRSRGFFSKAGLSHAQQRLWYLYQTEPGDPSYNMPGSLLLTGNLDSDALEKALSYLIGRHEILRTIFEFQEGEPIQKIIDSPEETGWKLEITDLSGCKDPEEEAKQLANEENSFRFDLTKGPLLRTTLARLDRNRHVLIFNLHHIIFDEWSYDVLLQELDLAYRAFCNGEQPPLQPLRFQYKDYAARQNRQIQEGHLKSSREYWTRKLNPVEEYLDLPPDYKRPATPDTRGETMQSSLDGSLLDSLRTYASKREQSLFVVLMAAFKTVLYRYTAVPDSVVGVPVTGRVSRELEQQLGFYINTLPLYDRIEENSSFRELVAMTGNSTREALAHQEYPFNLIVEDLKLPPQSNRTPLFTTVFNYLEAPDQEQASIGDVRCEPFLQENRSAKFDFVLQAIDRPGRVDLHITWRTELFERKKIEGFSRHFLNILSAVTEDDTIELEKLPMLGDEEAETLLGENWASKESPFPPSNITGLFEGLAVEKPSETAIMLVGDDETLDVKEPITFADLKEQSDKIATHLRKESGLEKGDIVMSCLGRTTSVLPVMLGIMKAGGVYLPVDPSLPDNRIAYMAKDASVSVVIVSPEERDRIATLLPEASLCTPEQMVNNSGEGALTPNPEDTAYVIYTSGSTGKPKGVLIRHSSLMDMASSYTTDDQFHLPENARGLLFGSFGFDICFLEIFPCYLQKGSVVLCGDYVRYNTDALANVIERYQVDYALLTPIVIHDLNRQPLPGLSVLGSGADKAVPEDLLHYHHQGVHVYNMYGPTEITVSSSFHKVESSEDYKHQPVPIGKAIRGVDHLILDPWGNLLPEGIPGELAIAGGQLAAGYLNRPELTEEKFPAHPFVPGKRIYKTGDLALRRFDGQFEFIGRNDHQVKVGAYRIEIGEIETVLKQHPNVHDAIVVTDHNRAGQNTLVAYVECRENSIQMQEVRKWMKQYLPDYMIPPVIHFLEKIPTLSNGKPDRTALKSLGASQMTPPPEAFSGESADVISRHFQDLLGISDVFSETHFFEQGGQSLKAAKLSGRILKETGIQIGISDIFNNPSAGDLAELLEQRLPARFHTIPKSPRQPHYPVSIAQYRLWVLDSMIESPSAYHIKSGFELEGECDLGALADAYRSLTERHDSLRVTFEEIDGEVVQRVHDGREPDVTTLDLSGRNDAGEMLNEFLEKIASHRFDLKNGPLCRLYLIRKSDHRAILIVHMHHIIGDKWSLEIFFEELLQLYLSRTGQSEDRLPELKIQYQDYAVWEKNRFDSGVGLEAGAFWKNLLSGELPVLELPSDKPRPAIKTWHGHQQKFSLEPGFTRSLQDLAAKNGSTLFSLLLATFRLTLNRYSGQQDIIIGTPVANRQHPDLEHQIGFFINMLPLRRSVSPERSFREELAEEGNLLRQALDYQHYPFNHLVQELDLQRDPSRSPLFDVAISYQEEEEPVESRLPVEIHPFQMSDTSSRFDMTWYFTQKQNGELELLCEYNTDLFSGERLQSLFTTWRQLADEAGSSPDRPVSELPLVSDSLKQTLIHEWGMAKRPYPSESTVPELFQEIAALHPEKCAAASLHTKLNYLDLEKQSSSLAIYLQHYFNLSEGDRVAVALPKSPQMTVVWLAILKTGAVYVPIDLNNPASRIQYILEDSSVSLTIINEDTDEELLPVGIRILNLNDSEKTWLQENRNGQPDTPDISPESPAYIIYTSGSTGKPKGSVIPHRGIIRLVKNSNYVPLGPEQRILQTGSPAFDASTFEIWGALLNGGTICFPPDGILLEADQLKETLTRQQISMLFLTTGLFNQLAEGNPELFSSVAYLLIGGEKISAFHINLARKACPETQFTNIYGPTENTTFSTFYPVESEEPDDVPIGRPVANTSVYILNDELQPVPPGMPGELFTGGDGVASGYVNREELTRERFLPDPFIPGGTMYRTGDLCAWNENGTIRFIGRSDNQVKVRGFRVEPDEIRHRLQKHPAIRDSFIHTPVASTGTREILAYYTGTETDPETLRNWIADELPAYMIPAAFIFLKTLPLNTNGKVDIHALPAPKTERTVTSEPLQPPRNEQETALHEVWAEILGASRIGRDQSYFELGGDSIKAIQCVNRLARRGWKVSVADIFTRPTIEALSAVMVPLQKRAGHVSISGDVSLTPVQKWFLDHHEEGLHHFNQSVMLTSGQRFQAEPLQRSLQSIAEFHDILRSSFRKEGALWIQSIAPADSWNAHIETVDYRKKNRAESLAEEHAADLQKRFNPESGPLFKAVLYRLPEADHLFLLAHHLIVDAVSWHILMENLSTVYSQACNGEEIRPGEPSASVKEWGEWIDRLSDRDFTSQKEWWEKALDGERSLSLIRDIRTHTYGSVQTIGFSLAEEETSALTGDLHAVYNTNIEDLLLTAVSRECTNWSKARNLTILLEGHGRDCGYDSPEINQTIGWFTSAYPVALPVQKTDPGEDLKQIKNHLRNTPDNGITYGLLAHIKKEIRSSEPAISFNYLGEFGAGEKQGEGIVLSPLDTGKATDDRLARHQILEFSALIRDGQLRLGCDYDPGLVDEPRLQECMNGIKQELAVLIDFCKRADFREKTSTDFTDRNLSEEDFGSIVDMFS